MDGRCDEEITERTAAAGRLLNEEPVFIKKGNSYECINKSFQKKSKVWNTTYRHRNQFRGAEMRFINKIEGKIRKKN